MGYYGTSVYRGDYYGQGDYYRYRRGDPGFFDFISDVGSAIGGAVTGVAKTILPMAAPVIGGLVGGPAGFALGGMAGSLLGRVLGPGPPVPNPPFLGSIAPPWAATAPGTGSTAAMIPSSPFAGVQIGPGGIQIGTSRQLPMTRMPGGSLALRPTGSGPSGATINMMRRQGVHVRGAHHKRMNPLNPRALSRALRRARGFQKYAKKVLKLVGEKRKVKGFKQARKRK
jgi:hypothetical protein